MPSLLRATTHLLDVLLISLYSHERTPLGFPDAAIKVIVVVTGNYLVKGLIPRRLAPTLILWTFT